MMRALAMVTVCALVLGSCHDEVQLGRGSPPPGGAQTTGVLLSELHAGRRLPRVQVRNPYAGDSRAIQEGRRLYGFYNCAGCHGAVGGGGIGPPLRDQSWIYGGYAENLFLSIVQGRPRGMPAYAGLATDEQVWKMIAFIHTLGGAPPDDREAAGSAGESAGTEEDEGETSGVRGR